MVNYEVLINTHAIIYILYYDNMIIME